MEQLLEPGEKYTRMEVQELLQVPEERRGGDWDTGYTTYNDETYIFCNIGSAGRTGHDYGNAWSGDELVWYAKTGSKIEHPSIQRMVSDGIPVHIFHRSADRVPFTYAGIGTPVEVAATTPVLVRWSFDKAPSVVLPQLTSVDVCGKLAKLGFELDAPGVKTRRATRGSTTVYIKLNSSKWILVIDPAFEDAVARLTAVRGVQRPTNRFFYHNSTMRSFPQRLHTGQSTIPYGIDFDFSSVIVLREFIDRLDHSPQGTVAASPSSASMAVDPKTETEATRAVRLGQQKFRNDLLDRWGGRCALTGLAIPGLLRASHIKPWCDSEPIERHDPNNGLLLAVHIDGLFDRGFISFDQDGRIMLSSELSEADLICFGISSDSKIGRLQPAHQKYLEHHRMSHNF
jgi:putative restriction endonuclease